MLKLTVIAISVFLTSSALARSTTVASMAVEGDAIDAIVQAGVSLDQAVEMVQKKYGARVSRASTIESGGRTIHEIRLVSGDGRVWTVRVDAATGREL